MPNWCDNRVYIWCDEPEVLKNFVKAFMPNGYLDFYAIVPLGLGNDEAGKPLWDYNTAIDKWGTKWPLCDEDADTHHISEDGIEATFDTAWGPPAGIYQSIDGWFAENTKDLSDYSISWFYDEPGMQFAGYLNNEAY